MKRKDFIKALAAACAVPVVAAKAIASHKKAPSLFIHDTCHDTIKHWKDYEHVKTVFDGDAWHIMPEDAPISKLIQSRKVVFDSDWGQVKLK